ncbi:SsgA family sporulation/cell division regulator [Streptomyces sp. 5-8]|uniref:SsgA family sporulation/cell division regulator n=1 Tax=Streptomyces musisoli TaxID=2802280 RepID=A0ABS1P982_9ACTN|nr:MULTISPECIES: SsgA family sporulation/cell division regulator [Streptomyces]MBL1108927.1 SsgA family sporulation/cell division regulator [Streptomyces musisoli]MBY8845294.1 SsgA family sporulation/cell division regulator [Streptomyces sp. SP2-10]
MNSFVHKTLVVQLLAPGTGRCPVLVHLGYDADDPFAVTAVFAHDGHVLASWRLDREMLSAGLSGPVGVGDVRLRPAGTGPWQELRMEFLGDARPGGGRHHAVVLVWAPAIAAFLLETHQVVPPGQERVPVDELLAEILSTG